jgi:hypothetical protein
MNTYTKEQREAWDKITGPGLYTVYGDGGYSYLVNRIKWVLLDKGDPHTVLLIGSEDERARLLKLMIEEGVIDGPADIEPWFFAFQDCLDKEDGEYYARSTGSEVDTERFCDFIRHATTNTYFPVGAVVILDEACGDDKSQKYLDRLLRIPVWRGSVIEKHIELPVYNVSRNAEWSEFSKATKTTPSGVTSTIEIEWGHEMRPERVEWLVPEFIPLHQTTAFSGEMDTRKSTLALDIAASGSLLRPWFMGTEKSTKPFITLVAADEDTYRTTVLPRFIAAKGYTPHLGCLNLNVRCQKQGPDGMQEWSTPLNFDAHLNLLADTINKVNTQNDVKVGLLINDPIISFFGDKNYNSSQDSRDIMRGLKKLCEELKITIVNICHFNKTQGLTAKQKTAGSKALIEAHRMAWAFDLMEDNPTTTLIAPIKHNLMKVAKSYKITTEDTFIKYPIGNRQHQTDHVGVIRFVGYSKMTADERIEEKERKDRGNRKQLKTAVLDLLKDGPMSAGQVCNQMQDLGSLRTVQRAAEQLEEEGKLKKSGNNRKNMVWQLATGAEQMPVFQGEATND